MFLLASEKSSVIAPPADAGGVLIDFFSWQRLLPADTPVESTLYRWNEKWAEPGVIVEKSKGKLIGVASELSLWLPNGKQRLAAVSVIGEKAAKDRQAIIVFMRSYLRKF